MKLNDLRRIALKRGARIRFTLPNGFECLVDDQGVLRIPALKAPPEFHLESEFMSVANFDVETGSANTLKTESLTSEQLLGAAPAAAAVPAEED